MVMNLRSRPIHKKVTISIMTRQKTANCVLLTLAITLRIIRQIWIMFFDYRNFLQRNFFCWLWCILQTGSFLIDFTQLTPLTGYSFEFFRLTQHSFIG